MPQHSLHHMAVDNSTIAVTVVIEEDGYAPISVDGALLNLFVDRLEVCVPETKFTVRIYLRDVYRLQPLDHGAITNAPELIFFTGHFAPRRYILRAFGPGSTTSLKMLYDMIRSKIQTRDVPPEFPFARTDVHRLAAEHIFGPAITPISHSHSAAVWGGGSDHFTSATYAPPINLEAIEQTPSVLGAFGWGDVKSSQATSRSTSVSVRQHPQPIKTGGGASGGATNLSSMSTAGGRRLPPDVGGAMTSGVRVRNGSPAVSRSAAAHGNATPGEGTSPLGVGGASTHSVTFMSPGDSPPGGNSAAGSSRRTPMSFRGAAATPRHIGPATGAPRPDALDAADEAAAAYDTVAVQTSPVTPALELAPLHSSSTHHAATPALPPAGPVAAPSAPLWFLRRQVDKMHHTDALLHRSSADVRSAAYNDILTLADRVSGSRRRWSSAVDDIQLPADVYYAHEAQQKAREFQLSADAPRPSATMVRTSSLHHSFGVEELSFSPIAQPAALDQTPLLNTSSAMQLHEEEVAAPAASGELSVEEAERRLQSRASLAALQRKSSGVRRDDVLRLLEQTNETPGSPKKLVVPLQRRATAADAKTFTAPSTTPLRATTMFVAAPTELPSRTAPLAAAGNAAAISAPVSHQSQPSPSIASHSPPPQATGLLRASTLVVAPSQTRSGAAPTQRPPPLAASKSSPPRAAGGATQLPSTTSDFSPTNFSVTSVNTPHAASSALFKTYTGIPFADSFVDAPLDERVTAAPAVVERGASVSSTGSSPVFFSSPPPRPAASSTVHVGGTLPSALVEADSDAPPHRHPSHEAPKMRPAASRILAMGGVPMPHLQPAPESPPSALRGTSSSVVVKKVAPPPTPLSTSSAAAGGGGPVRPSLDGAPILLRRVATTGAR